jgi:hypothetical protein
MEGADEKGTGNLELPESFGSTSDKSCHSLERPSLIPATVFLLRHLHKSLFKFDTSRQQIAL